VLLDAAIPPIDKACGEGLMPDGVEALRELGITSNRDDHAIFQGIRFVGRLASVQAQFPSGTGIGLRRTVLHDLLRRRAEELGVISKWGTRVTGISRRVVTTDRELIKTRFIVGADGQNSRVREWTGLHHKLRTTLRVGYRRHFRVERWTDFVEVHWGDAGQVYVTPVADHEICVATISRDRHVGFDAVIAQCPDLARNLQGAVALDDVRGSATASLRLRSVVAEGVALIGEASGSVDAITGEGMTLAFRQAVELARAVGANDLRIYAAAHRRIGRLPNLLGSAMLLMDRNSDIRNRALKALNNKPSIFERLLAVHLGESSPFDFEFSELATLGWQLLTA
jgi:flavin-dependent dehydrogenase